MIDIENSNMMLMPDIQNDGCLGSGVIDGPQYSGDFVDSHSSLVNFCSYIKTVENLWQKKLVAFVHKFIECAHNIIPTLHNNKKLKNQKLKNET